MQLVERLSETPSSVAFGRFRVLPHRRELLADGRPVKLGGRAFDVLITLLEARGSVVSREELIRRVWPNRVVEEKNLHAQISVLRTVLGAERELIRTVPGHGYQFTGEIRVLSGNPDERAGATMAAAQPAAALPPTNLPEPVSELIGRDDELCEILALAAHRLVTLTGPGGIGKTRLALAAARRLLPQFADGVWLAEFSSLSDPALVPATVAAAVGLELGAGEVSAQRVAQTLADRQLLLVLDTCEHMIAAAAAMVETVLRACSGLRVIATSREPLRAEGEQTYPVPPLAVPAEDTDAEDDPLQYGAVQLFVVRSRANGAYVSEDRHGAAAIAAICRQLDGIPLAIELAAARVAALGIEEVAARLDDRFRLADWWAADGTATAPDLAGDARLELRALGRGRTRAPAPTGGLCRRLQPGSRQRGRGERRDRAGGGRLRPFRSGREVACRGGGRGPPHRPLSIARHDASLRARKARRKWRTRTPRAPPR